MARLLQTHHKGIGPAPARSPRLWANRPTSLPVSLRFKWFRLWAETPQWLHLTTAFLLLVPPLRQHNTGSLQMALTAACSKVWSSNSNAMNGSMGRRAHAGSSPACLRWLSPMAVCRHSALGDDLVQHGCPRWQLGRWWGLWPVLQVEAMTER